MLARLDTGITDKFELEKSSTLKPMQNKFTKSYIHVAASFQNLALATGSKGPLGSPGTGTPMESTGAPFQ